VPNRGRRVPRRRFRGSSDAHDRVIRFNFIHRSGLLGQKLLRGSDRYEVIPEPDEELEDSELTESEQRQAIMRERTRRQGLT
jgi:hypothetical protein